MASEGTKGLTLREPERLRLFAGRDRPELCYHGVGIVSSEAVCRPKELAIDEGKPVFFLREALESYASAALP